jgi:mannose-6-phosphate isomerase-like protein (cupin superfamily)
VDAVWFIASLAEVLVERGDFSLLRMHAPAGDQPPLHVHAYEHETFYVLEGSMTLWVGDAEPVVLGAGECATAPPGIPHTYRVGDSGGVYLVATCPGAFAAFVRAAGEPASRLELPVLEGPPDAERLARIAADHDITLLGPPGMLPRELAAV